MPYTGDAGASLLSEVDSDNKAAADAQKTKTQHNTASAAEGAGDAYKAIAAKKAGGVALPGQSGMKITMHRGGIVPGKKGEDVPIIAQAGEKIIPAGRTSEYRKVFMKRKNGK